MSTLVSVIHVVTCVLLVLLVLIQSGKGAEISASFSGSSQTVFGSSGGANFFTRFTTAMATIFMITSVILTIMGGQTKKSIFDDSLNTPITPAAPVSAPADNASAAAPAKAAPAAPTKK